LAKRETRKFQTILMIYTFNHSYPWLGTNNCQQNYNTCMHWARSRLQSLCQFWKHRRRHLKLS